MVFLAVFLDALFLLERRWCWDKTAAIAAVVKRTALKRKPPTRRGRSVHVRRGRAGEVEGACDDGRLGLGVLLAAVSCYLLPSRAVRPAMQITTRTRLRVHL